MPKKGENIRKRTDGRWEGRYKSGVNQNGISIYSSVYAKTYSEVKIKLLTAKNQTHCGTKTIQKVIFREIAEQWLSDNQFRLKDTTKNKYNHMLQKHIFPCFGDKNIEKISFDQITLFINSKINSGRLKDGSSLSASYVKTMAVLMEAIFKYAKSENICVSFNKNICKPTVIKKDIHILSDDALKKLEDTVSTCSDGIQLGVFIAIHTGLRIGEICALTWSDIDLLNKVIHVRHTVSRIQNISETSKTKVIITEPKSNSSKRDIPISSALFPILQAKKQSSSVYVVSNSLSFISTRDFDYYYKKLLASNDMIQINFHSLRHTFATRCVAAGVDIKSLSEILGHSNVSITVNIKYPHERKFKSQGSLNCVEKRALNKHPADILVQKTNLSAGYFICKSF